ncbi:MAG: type II toxin-antitoxin system HicA family toxin [Nitrospinae bacterium]|nr:type II toxin-antitoxin system HicA family toxin [Nitrospinota bacterium]
MGDFYKQVTRELANCGFAYWRAAKGSHELWRNSATNKKVIVPRKLTNRHTANGILRVAGSSLKV